MKKSIKENQTEQLEKDAFCKGFAYGCRYGYENILHGHMKDSDIIGTWILAQLLFNELKEEQDEKNK
jgi:hypothetical protein